jgi:hypothetical protein
VLSRAVHVDQASRALLCSLILYMKRLG